MTPEFEGRVTLHVDQWIELKDGRLFKLKNPTFVKVISDGYYQTLATVEVCSENDEDCKLPFKTNFYISEGPLGYNASDLWRNRSLDSQNR